jgi:hypothetical protein
MKIAFHSKQLSMRGTEVALFDYAYFNREYLGNESLIISDKKNDLAALRKFQDHFDLYLYEEFSEIERTFSTQIILFSSIYLHYFQDRNYLNQLLSSPRFNKGIRVNL